MSLPAVRAIAEGLLKATIFCAPVAPLYKRDGGATRDEIFSSQKYYEAVSGAKRAAARHNTFRIIKKQALNYKHATRHSLPDTKPSY